MWGHARRRGCGTARTRPAGAADIVGRLMGSEVCIESSRKPVKQHICCFYWLTRGGEAAAVGLAGGGVLVHKEFLCGRGPILSTQTLSGGRAPDFIYTELAEISFSLFRRVIV